MAHPCCAYTPFFFAKSGNVLAPCVHQQINFAMPPAGHAISAVRAPFIAVCDSGNSIFALSLRIRPQIGSRLYVSVQNTECYHFYKNIDLKRGNGEIQVGKSADNNCYSLQKSVLSLYTTLRGSGGLWGGARAGRGGSDAPTRCQDIAGL